MDLASGHPVTSAGTGIAITQSARYTADMNNQLKSLFLCTTSLVTALGTYGCTSPAPSEAPTNTPEQDAQPGIELTLQDGVIQGVQRDGARVFYGIPYAVDTAVSGRFEPPQPVSTWDGSHDATQPGPACAQPTLGGSSTMASEAEDCLHVDVWAPTEVPEAPLPVMVWFHGGGFRFGKTDFYPGNALVERDVVVVMVSYRLGALGFLSYPDPTTGKPTVANAGIQDQQLALQWVQENIAVFGGDPTNVTLFGQSAGATSICQHMVSPQSSGLFHRAIMQSGACNSLVTETEPAIEQGKALARALECEDADDVFGCLQSAPIESIVQAVPAREDTLTGATQFRWGPTVDGRVIPAWPAAMLAQGDFNPVPVLFGTNLHDGVFFVFVRGLLSTRPEAYQDTLATVARGYDLETVSSLYPLGEDNNPIAPLADILSDKMFNCPMGVDARSLDTHGVPVFRYHFTQPIDAGFLAELGTSHGAEMPYIFGGPVEDAYFLAEEDFSLATTIADYWVQFAYTGNPNTDKHPSWPAFRNLEESYIELNDALEVRTELRQKYCAFWDDYPVTEM
ncbi:MAG: carboxylesterase family protein [Myxococcota bacterium]|nr:carboxylesterase family protein [Myxococcota bacterium]